MANGQKSLAKQKHDNCRQRVRKRCILQTVLRLAGSGSGRRECQRQYTLETGTTQVVSPFSAAKSGTKQLEIPRTRNPGGGYDENRVSKGSHRAALYTGAASSVPTADVIKIPPDCKDPKATRRTLYSFPTRPPA